MARKSVQFCSVFAVFCLLLSGTYSFAADVVTLYPQRSTFTVDNNADAEPAAANDNKGLRFQKYHVDVADFAVGDLVLTRSNFLGEVLEIRGNKLIVEGRFLSGLYKPTDFVKETESVRGIKVGSWIKDGAGNWGKLIRAWEDGRIELYGRYITSIPFHIDKMKIVEVIPPKEKSTNPIVRFCESIMSLW